MLCPSWEALRKLILQQQVVGADETRWRLMDGKSLSKCYVFILSSMVGLYYTFKESKSAQAAAEVIEDFSGWLMVDGAPSYISLYNQLLEQWQRQERANPPFNLVSCWAHCRRKYINAAKNFVQANRMLDLIAMLYRVVEAADQDPTVEPSVRHAWVKAIFTEMERWMRQNHSGAKTAANDLDRAIAYTRRLWPRLTALLDHPEVWLDNNPSERGLRQPVLGRKNHYGSRSQEGMEMAAIFYSLIETCQLIEVDPKAYLFEAAKRLMERPGSVFLPHEMLQRD